MKIDPKNIGKFDSVSEKNAYYDALATKEVVEDAIRRAIILDNSPDDEDPTAGSVVAVRKDRNTSEQIDLKFNPNSPYDENLRLILVRTTRDKDGKIDSTKEFEAYYRPASFVYRMLGGLLKPFGDLLGKSIISSDKFGTFVYRTQNTVSPEGKWAITSHDEVVLNNNRIPIEYNR